MKIKIVRVKCTQCGVIKKMGFDVEQKERFTWCLPCGQATNWIELTKSGKEK